MIVHEESSSAVLSCGKVENKKRFQSFNSVKFIIIILVLIYRMSLNSGAKIDTVALGHKNKSKMLINVCPNSSGFGVVRQYKSK